MVARQRDRFAALQSQTCESEWLGLGSCDGLVVCIDARAVMAGAGVNVKFSLETAPIEDEA